MQTMAPPEDAATERFARLDERFDGVDAKFARVNERLVDVDRRIAEAAQETNRRLKEVDRRITEGKEETNRQIEANTAELKSFRQEIRAFHSTFQRGNYILVATMVGAILTLLIKGG